LLAGERFCGPVCARAFVLEALELVESSSAPSVLRDLEDIRVALRYLLTVMAIQGSPVASRAGPALRGSEAGTRSS
jgi:hypothetical protein